MSYYVHWLTDLPLLLQRVVGLLTGRSGLWWGLVVTGQLIVLVGQHVAGAARTWMSQELIIVYRLRLVSVIAHISERHTIYIRRQIS